MKKKDQLVQLRETEPGNQNHSAKHLLASLISQFDLQPFSCTLSGNLQQLQISYVPPLFVYIWCSLAHF
jgi:hypothetical protein